MIKWHKRRTDLKPVLLGLLILALCIMGIRLMAHREAMGRETVVIQCDGEVVR